MPDPHRESSAADPARLLEAMCDGVYAVDLDRRVTFWNAAAAGISGYDAAQVLGRWCGDGLLNHVDESGRSMCGTRCPLLETMQDGQARTARVYLHHERGHVIPVRVNANALRDDSGLIVGAVESFSDDSHTAAAESRLRHAESLAMTDHLTGLGNRRFLEHRLAERVAQVRSEDTFSVVLVDLDRFKQINDSVGHVAGDQVLIAVANSLRHVVDESDDVTRFGGDEFVILSGPRSADALAAFAARVRTAVAATRVRAGGRLIRPTASVGAAHGDACDTAETVTVRADVAMLAAKRDGRKASAVEATGRP